MESTGLKSPVWVSALGKGSCTSYVFQISPPAPWGREGCVPSTLTPQSPRGPNTDAPEPPGGRGHKCTESSFPRCAWRCGGSALDPSLGAAVAACRSITHVRLQGTHPGADAGPARRTQGPRTGHGRPSLGPPPASHRPGCPALRCHQAFVPSCPLSPGAVPCLPKDPGPKHQSHERPHPCSLLPPINGVVVAPTSRAGPRVRHVPGHTL